MALGQAPKDLGPRARWRCILRRVKLEPGSAVGRYRIEAQLGAGGMGAVYQARDSELGRRVAIKVIAREASQDLIERMRREARAASALSHANAATVFDVGEIDGNPYIVMELIEGRPLRALVGDTAASIETKLDLLKQVAAALAAAHDVGLVHRDVKPENVVVRSDGVAKLLDFGIAKVSPAVDPSSPTALETPAQLTRTGTSVGSPAYMSPEQIRGEPIDGRADQFSWGVTAFEVLAGSLPWRGKASVFEIAASILHDDPRPLGEVAPQVPAHVCLAIARALAKDPARRFSDMRELAKALDQATPATVPLSSDSVRALVAAGAEASTSTGGEGREPVGSTAVTSPLSLPVRRPLPWVPIALVLVCLLGGAWLLREQLGGRPESSGASTSTTAQPLASSDAPAGPGTAPTPSSFHAAQASASASANAPPVVRCEDKKAQPCAKDNEPWCDASGKSLTCCVKGLVSTPQGRCVCAPGGVTNDALVTNGCKRAEPEYPPRVQKVVRANFPDLKRCYEAALKQNPKLSGDVSVAFLIAPGGEFYRGSIAGSSTPDPMFQDCLVGIFTKLRADPPPDGHMIITYPLAFTPGE